MNKEIYLAGTMTHTNDYGRRWRLREQRWLAARGEKAFSPPDREHELLVKYDIKPSLLRNGSNKIPHSIRKKLFGEIVRFDLDQLRFRTKYCVVYFTELSPGTVSEMTWCYMHNIPVYVVTRQRLRPWLEACSTKVFETFEQLRNFLKYTYGLKVKK